LFTLFNVYFRKLKLLIFDCLNKFLVKFYFCKLKFLSLPLGVKWFVEKNTKLLTFDFLTHFYYLVILDFTSILMVKYLDLSNSIPFFPYLSLLRIPSNFFSFVDILMKSNPNKYTSKFLANQFRIKQKLKTKLVLTSYN